MIREWFVGILQLPVTGSSNTGISIRSDDFEPSLV